MNRIANIYVAGHRGLVDSVLMRRRTNPPTPANGGGAGGEGDFMPPLVNIGVGEDITIEELAEAVKAVVGYQGEIVFDSSKPDGTPRKLLDVSQLHCLGWIAKTELRKVLDQAYRDFLE